MTDLDQDGVWEHSDWVRMGEKIARLRDELTAAVRELAAWRAAISQDAQNYHRADGSCYGCGKAEGHDEWCRLGLYEQLLADPSPAVATVERELAAGREFAREVGAAQRDESAFDTFTRRVEAAYGDYQRKALEAAQGGR